MSVIVFTASMNELPFLLYLDFDLSIRYDVVDISSILCQFCSWWYLVILLLV